MNIAVFADLHGRILLAFMLCARWQRETGEHISAILQAGDLAAFPDRSRLDRATIRHADADPDELGFLQDFMEPREEVASHLAETSCPLIFVRGNHEDHAWLNGLEAQSAEELFPIDAYARIFCLRTGMLYTLRGDDSQLNLLGIGRIGAPVGSDKSDAPRYAQMAELERLYDLGAAQVDVLLTHDVPPTYVNRRSLGLEEIRLALDTYKPLYHIFGHTDEPHRRYLDQNGVTSAIRMADLNWDRADRGAPLNAEAMGVLRWRSRDDHAFEAVDAPWLREYTMRTWRWSM